MAVYRCKVCGYIFDEEKEGKSIRDIDVCPRCKQPDDKFELVEDSSENSQEKQQIVLNFSSISQTKIVKCEAEFIAQGVKYENTR